MLEYNINRILHIYIFVNHLSLIKSNILQSILYSIRKRFMKQWKPISFKVLYATPFVSLKTQQQVQQNYIRSPLMSLVGYTILEIQ